MLGLMMLCLCLAALTSAFFFNSMSPYYVCFYVFFHLIHVDFYSVSEICPYLARVAQERCVRYAELQYAVMMFGFMMASSNGSLLSLLDGIFPIQWCGPRVVWTESALDSRTLPLVEQNLG